MEIVTFLFLAALCGSVTASGLRGRRTRNAGPGSSEYCDSVECSYGEGDCDDSAPGVFPGAERALNQLILGAHRIILG